MREKLDPGGIAFGGIHIPGFQAIEEVKAGWRSR